MKIDDPNPRANVRRTAGGRFPPISSRFPMMEGYAFITLDSNLGDIGDNQSVMYLYFLVYILITNFILRLLALVISIEWFINWWS